VRQISFSATAERPLKVTSLLWPVRHAGLLVILLTLMIFVAASRRLLQVDDAFMFYRYALHFREGLGIAWNATGGHTYGLTSLGWFFVVLPFSYLPLPPSAVLVLASSLTCILALGLMTWGVAHFATALPMRSIWVALPLATLPLVASWHFGMNATNGMETMLSLLANVLLVLAALQVMRAETSVATSKNAALLGLSGYFAFFVRPDNGLCAVLLPLLLWLFWPSFRRKQFAIAEGCLFALIALQLLSAYRYFGTTVPLAFYVKSLNGYKGYLPPVDPGVELARFLFMAFPFLWVALAVTRRRMHWEFLAIFFVPVLLTCLYLLTVTQIMGRSARYYVPLLPLLVIPSLLALDRWIRENPDRSLSEVSWLRASATAVVVLVGILAIRAGSRIWVAHADRKIVFYTEPTRVLATAAPLKGDVSDAMLYLFGDVVVHGLPKGTIMAASEVGYIGARAPQIDIIDLVGLNDKDIALHGFSMRRLLQQAPDLIWLPHEDYTWLRTTIWNDPAFLSRYEIFDHAFHYGVAIRKTSPRRQILEHQLAIGWSMLYPHAEMKNYLVQGLRMPANLEAKSNSLSERQ
jgi:hypothetical protein